MYRGAEKMLPHVGEGLQLLGHQRPRDALLHRNESKETTGSDGGPDPIIQEAEEGRGQ